MMPTNDFDPSFSEPLICTICPLYRLYILVQNNEISNGQSYHALSTLPTRIMKEGKAERGGDSTAPISARLKLNTSQLHLLDQA